MTSLPVSSGDPLANLIPQPWRVTPSAGSCTLDQSSTLYADAPGLAELLRELLAPATGLPLSPAPSDRATIRLLLDATASYQPEEYHLEVGDDGVTVRSGTEQGLRWGIQTLRQLLPPENFSSKPQPDVIWRLPGVRIVDRPRLGWRGALLDVGRWYQPISFVRRFVDWAAMHKLNVVHLHLTEDQGWRFESSIYPRLTKIGAWRAESRRGHWRDGHLDGTPHGGFYTQRELRDLVSYAARRGVTVMPEIDVPGHSQAAIAAYPHLGNNPDIQLPVETGWGVIPRILNAEDSTIAFYRDVLDEVMDVFPSTYIHLGGDECPYDEWRVSTRAQTLARERGLASVDMLHGWMMGQLADHVTRAGRRVVGWDELLDGQVPEGTTVMSWRGESGGVAAARAGYDVVMTPDTYVYFNQYQSEDLAAEPISGDGVITLERLLGYNPVPTGLTDEERKRVLGAECALWCEHLSTPEEIEYQAFPRWSAFADAAWAQASSRSDRGRRVKAHLSRLDANGIGYRRDPK